MISRTKPTVRTIAAELGVSAMTITRALNGHPKVSTETRRRVLAKVKEVGYDFRASSRTVRQERDRNVAIHCGDDKLYSDNILNFYMRLHYLCQRRLKAEGLRGQLIDLNVHAEAAFPVLDNCGSLILLGPVEQARLETVRKRYPELRIISVFGSVDGVTQVGRTITKAAPSPPAGSPRSVTATLRCSQPSPNPVSASATAASSLNFRPGSRERAWT